MTDEEFMKATKEGNIPMSDEEIAQLIADRESIKDRPVEKTIEERVAALEVKVSKIKV